MIEHAGREPDLERPIRRLCNEACSRARRDQIDIAGATQMRFPCREATGAHGGCEMDDDPVIADRLKGVWISLRARGGGDAADR
jgi:hypothetical protein